MSGNPIDHFNTFISINFLEDTRFEALVQYQAELCDLSKELRAEMNKAAVSSNKNSTRKLSAYKLVISEPLEAFKDYEKPDFKSYLSKLNSHFTEETLMKLFNDEEVVNDDPVCALYIFGLGKFIKTYNLDKKSELIATEFEADAFDYIKFSYLGGLVEYCNGLLGKVKTNVVSEGKKKNIEFKDIFINPDNALRVTDILKSRGIIDYNYKIIYFEIGVSVQNEIIGIAHALHEMKLINTGISVNTQRVFEITFQLEIGDRNFLKSPDYVISEYQKIFSCLSNNTISNKNE